MSKGSQDGGRADQGMSGEGGSCAACNEAGGQPESGLDAATDGGTGGAGGAGGAGAIDGPSDVPTDAGADQGVDAGVDTRVDVRPGVDLALGSDLGVDLGLGVDTGAGGDAVGSVCAQCTSYGEPQALGTISSELPELSGLAASHLHPGILYTHNDSGDSARFFAMNESAVVTAEMHLTGATATDWEDISVGACPSGTCVYIGDTGDNKIDRQQYVIYRVTEPAALPTDGSIITVEYEQFPFVYPDGPHNAETLLVHPVTGQIFIITKDKTAAAKVFEMPMPLKANQQVTVVETATLVLDPTNDGIATDGAFHPCGDRLLLRTTKFLFEFRRQPGDSLVSLFTSTPVQVPVADEPQGESVTFALDGLHYFTSSETKSGGTIPSLSVVGCATQ